MESKPNPTAELNIVNGGSVAVITLSSPPLNPLSHQVRDALLSHLSVAANEYEVEMIIINGSNNNFSAGADIKEMKDFSEASGISKVPLTTVVKAIEECPKPVVAVIEGVAFGGGLEVALSCHYRVAMNTAKLSLPEVKIGLIPGAGGTQRLPKLVPIQHVIDIVTTGKVITASDALKMGLIDHLFKESSDIYQSTFDCISSRSDYQKMSVSDSRKCKTRPTFDPPEKIKRICDEALKRCGPPVNGREPIWSAIVAIREVANERATFDDGLKLESSLFLRLIASQQSRARRHLFLAERLCGRLSFRANPLPVRQVGVIGAGTMGSGISIAFLLSGFKVTMVDVNPEALKRGTELVQRSIGRNVKRGRITEERATALLANLSTRCCIGPEMKAADLVVEAAIERMDLKKKIFGELDAVCSPAAILCTNTSSLDVDAIASATRRPKQCMGMHFFSPAQAMPLVECVRGRETSHGTIATVMHVARQLSKVGVLVGNCDGFVGNRMLKNYTNEVLFLLEEGTLPRQVDVAMIDFGMVKGPLETSDIAGNDISYFIRQARGLTNAETRPKGERYSALGDELFHRGRLGQKTGKGWYRYEESSYAPLDDPEVTEMIEDHRKRYGFDARRISDEEIVMRCMLSMVNEGFRILEEGVAARPSDIDVIWRYGYSFPDFRGGPMFWADEMGLSQVLRRIESFRSRFPNILHWVPSPLLQRIVADGCETSSDWFGGRVEQRDRSKL